jgi:hypothetical protein
MTYYFPIKLKMFPAHSSPNLIHSWCTATCGFPDLLSVSRNMVRNAISRLYLHGRYTFRLKTRSHLLYNECNRERVSVNLKLTSLRL